MHSRESGDSRSSANRYYADLVKWQGTPIRLPLLRLPNDLAPLALECFDCILRYCGDLPMEPDLTEVKCVYTVLMVSGLFYFNQWLFFKLHLIFNSIIALS